MITLEDFQAAHWDEMLEQQAMAWTRKFITPEQLQELERHYAYTFRNDGKIIMCGGFIKYWEGRGEAWAHVAQDAGRHFITLTKMVRRLMQVIPLRRIESLIDVKFPQAHRWMLALGFEMEAPLLKSYFPDGRDAALYARVR